MTQVVFVFRLPGGGGDGAWHLEEHVGARPPPLPQTRPSDTERLV